MTGGLSEGDLLPELSLSDSSGGAVSLRALGGEETLIVFLRHLACLPCREHLVEVLEHREELGLRVAVVGFARWRGLARYQERLGLTDTIVLSDPDRETYRAFGFGRGSVARVWLDPRVWARYLSLMARGRRPAPPKQDTLQLGGDVLVGTSGTIEWIYRSRGPEDRPSLRAIAAARERAAG